MNDHPPPVENAMSEALEVRIVAWVLGEASAFEIAELERICAENATAREFHRHMSRVHRLLEQAEPSGGKGDWLLPPMKRQVLENRFGVAPVPVERSQEAGVRNSAWRVVYGIAACLAATIVVVKLMPGSEFAASEKVVASSPLAYESYREAPRDELSAPARKSSEAGESMVGELSYQFEDESRNAPPSAPSLSPSATPEDSEVAARGVAEDSPAGAPRGGRAIRKSSRIDFGNSEGFGEGWGLESPQPGPTEPEPAIAGAGGSSFGSGREQSDGTATRSALDGIASRSAGSSRDSGEDSLEQSAEADLGLSRAEPEADRSSLGRRAEDERLGLQLPTPANTPGGSAAMPQDAVTTPNAPSASSALVQRARQQRESAAAESSEFFAMRDAEAKHETAAEPRSAVARQESQDSLGGGELENAHNDPFADAGPEMRDELRSLMVGEPENGAVPTDAVGDTVDSDRVRQGLEKVEEALSNDYRYRASDTSRADLLKEVDRAWELTIPADVAESDAKTGDAQLNLGEALPQLHWLEQKTEVLEDLATRSIDGPGEPRPSEEGAELSAATADAKELAEPDGLDLVLPGIVAPEPLPADDPEIDPAIAPYSTFSLNVSDSSFQLAAAAIARGERPDPSSIKPEHFYNAVDYGDPAPTGAEPVAGQVEQSADPVLPNRNLVRIALKTAAAGRSAAQPLTLTLVVDQSGSMIREDRRAALLEAGRQLATLLGEGDSISVIGFSRTPRLIVENLRSDLAANLQIAMATPADQGGTNLEEALKLAEEIALRHYDPQAQNRVVLFTDGAANLGDANSGNLAGRIVGMRQQGLALDVAGVGADGLNDRLLSELARHGNGRYHVLSVAEGEPDGTTFARQLAGAFRPAAKDVKVQVEFNPARVTSYRLVGFQEDLLRPEDFRNDAVDAAELAAEEAGVALYQIQTDPEGNGEIGAVSVRFLDTASGEIVERSWMIPYEPAAPAFDKASPSLQLAGLAMVAAEKLRGGSIAKAVDFSSLAASRAIVRSHYANSPAVRRLLAVIAALE
jgi:Mg-chelatase subunit ChlD